MPLQLNDLSSIHKEEQANYNRTQSYKICHPPFSWIMTDVFMPSSLLQTPENSSDVKMVDLDTHVLTPCCPPSPSCIATGPNVHISNISLEMAAFLRIGCWGGKRWIGRYLLLLNSPLISVSVFVWLCLSIWILTADWLNNGEFVMSGGLFQTHTLHTPTELSYITA